MEALLIYLFTGVVAGILAGLLGVGGGIIIVPALVFVFHAQNFEPAVIVHLAIGTSLASIVLTSISSVRAHHKRGAVQWPVFWKLTPGIIVGSLVGAAIAGWLPTEALRVVFAVFVLLVSLQMGLGAKPAPHRELPGTLGVSLAGTLIGIVSALVGIGGGALTVPFLVWCNVAMRNAVAISAACGLPIAVAGSVGFFLAGLEEPGLPAWSSGYLYWPAAAGIAVASVLFAPLGARLSHQIPADRLKRFFALFIAFVGLRMLLG